MNAALPGARPGGAIPRFASNSIRTKLVLIAVSVLAVILGLLVGGERGIATMNRAHRLEMLIERNSGTLEKVLKSIKDVAVNGDTIESYRNGVAALADLDAALSETAQAMEGSAAWDRFSDSLLPLLAGMKSDVRTLLNAENEGIGRGTPSFTALFDKAVRAGDTAAAELSAIRAEVGTDAEVEAERILLGLYAGAALALVCVVVIFTMHYYALISPIREVGKFAHRIAAGDFSAELSMRRRDEIGVLARDLREMSDSMRKALGGLKSTSTALSESLARAGEEASVRGRRVAERLESHEVGVTSVVETSRKLEETTADISVRCDDLKTMADEAAGAVEKIVHTVDIVADGALAHTAAAAETAKGVNGMLEAIGDISLNLASLASSSTQVAVSIEQMRTTVDEVTLKTKESSRAAAFVCETATVKGLAAVASAEAGVTRIHDRVGDLAETIQRLDQRSRSIGEIVLLIDDIASQTSLLALNAAILAAQAGAKGEAFAVVASEVKALAERISHSTREIAKTIGEANRDTAASVELSRKGLEEAREGLGLIHGVRGALEEINANAAKSAELSTHIEYAMAEQATGAREISGVVSNVAKQVETMSAFAREIEAGGNLVLKSMEEIRTGSERITAQTHSQRTDARTILDGALKMNRSAVQMAAEVGGARDEYRRVAETLATLHRTARELSGDVTDLGRSIAQLEGAAAKVAEDIGRFSV